MNKTIIQERLAFWQGVYSKLQQAYVALIDGGVQSYTIDDRSLHRFDLPEIKNQMENAEKKISELTAMAAGKRPRKAFGIVPTEFAPFAAGRLDI